MRVRQEDAGQARLSLSWGNLIQTMELLPEIRRRVEDPPLVANRIDESKACHQTLECWIRPARMLLRARLRSTSILRDPEHDEVGRSICRRRFLLASRRIPVQQMQKREREDYESVFLHSSKVILLEVESARVSL